jgi:hypothetical protein
MLLQFPATLVSHSASCASAFPFIARHEVAANLCVFSLQLKLDD